MNGKEFGDWGGGGWTLVTEIDDEQVMKTLLGLRNATY